jgi:hypothetical protein
MITAKRTIVVAAAAVVLLSMACLGHDFGAPRPAGERGQMSLGLGYHYYTSEWEYDRSALPSSDYTRKQMYLRFAYAFLGNWEGSFRLGIADAKFRWTYPFDDRFDFKDGHKPAVGIGIRGIAYESGPWLAGPVIHANAYPEYSQLTQGDYNTRPSNFRWTYDGMWDLSIGAGVGYDSGLADLYITPYLYWARSDVTGVWKVDDEVQESWSTTANEKGIIGGRAGVVIDFTGGFDLSVEGQYQSGFCFTLALNKVFGSD